MDIVIQNELPTEVEREAVDAVLGPPGSSWEGAREASKRDQHVARGGHAARARRHLLLPTLHAVQARVGWISRGALNYISRRLTIPPAEAYGVASFYALFSLEPQPPVVAHVCTDVACIARGSQELVAELERRVGPEGEHPGNGQAVWHESPCLGHVRARARGDADGGARGAARGGRRAGHGRRHRRHARRRRGAAAAAAARPAGRRAGPAAAAPHRRGRPGEHRQLPRPRRLRGAARRDRDGAGPRAARGHGLEAAGPRRRRVPDGPQVGGGRAQRQAPALPDLQRRRVRAGHVQGPCDPRARPVLDHRGDDDRRHRHRLRARLPVPARRVPARLGPARRRDHRRRARAASSARTSSARATRSTSSCARAPAPTSAARRPRCSTRSRGIAASRATSRRSPSTGACSTSPP